MRSRHKTMSTTSSPLVVPNKASRKTHQQQKALPRESKLQTNPCWVLMCRFSPNRTKMRIWKSTTYNLKKCHGDDIKESTRNHNFVQHTPLRSNLLTISTIHLQKNCKKSQKRLPHRICKQDQAWINLQHSKFKTDRKGSVRTRFHHPNRENLHTYDGYLNEVTTTSQE